MPIMPSVASQWKVLPLPSVSDAVSHQLDGIPLAEYRPCRVIGPMTVYFTCLGSSIEAERNDQPLALEAYPILKSRRRCSMGRPREQAKLLQLR